MILSSLSSAVVTSSFSSSDDETDEHETSETVVVAVYGGKRTYCKIDLKLLEFKSHIYFSFLPHLKKIAIVVCDHMTDYSTSV